jgi:hypothetical protein
MECDCELMLFNLLSFFFGAFLEVAGAEPFYRGLRIGVDQSTCQEL